MRRTKSDDDSADAKRNLETTRPEPASSPIDSIQHPVAGALQIRVRRLKRQTSGDDLPADDDEDNNNNNSSPIVRELHQQFVHQTNRKRLITARVLQAIITLVNIVFLAASPVLVQSISASSSSSSAYSSNSTLQSSAADSLQLAQQTNGNFISSMTVHTCSLLTCALFFAVLVWPQWFKRSVSARTMPLVSGSTETLVHHEDTLGRRSVNSSKNLSWLVAEICVNFAMLTAELVAFLQWFLWSVCLPTGAGGEDQKCLAVVSTVKGLCWIEVFSWIVVLGFSLERYKAWLWIQEI